jgi:hypothetical protein
MKSDSIDKQKILSELAKVKAIFQQRAILAALGVAEKPTDERKE